MRHVRLAKILLRLASLHEHVQPEAVYNFLITRSFSPHPRLPYTQAIASNLSSF